MDEKGKRLVNVSLGGKWLEKTGILKGGIFRAGK
jgi:hypothetical protein